MKDATPTPVLRKDYQPPAFRVDTVDLTFDLGEEHTRVRARIALRRNELAAADAPLVLDGEELQLLGVQVDGRALAEGEYTIARETLTIHSVPDSFVLETEVQLEPQNNTSLSGLYKSSGNFCTQCEAQGFRRITFFLDRPDVMARYTTTIEADPERYPVLLSNGNRVASEDLGGGRRRVKWEDPFPKPSYLFALVAGDLRCHGGNFTTRSGRDVRLEIWVEPQNIDKCEHALVSLQNAMKWDEDVYGLEYDLDIYMVVAVNDFNMGAMENKGLNIFNSKFVLARPDTATDGDYEGIEGVIGHEYFHNWTGNRVTCRDWFQLTLKEGLTVFRDEQFSADMTSAPVKRISDVKALRTMQFAEAAGPMAHPIRPESYIEMNNFYTMTVYRKGAAVVAMYHTLLGQDGFRKGMDLYFERHDGQAVECDDFRAAMADANGVDLTQFERWYSQAHTPVVKAEGSWDKGAGTYTLRLAQSAPSLKGHADAQPFHVPVTVGLVAPGGSDLPLHVDGVAAGATSCVLQLTEPEQTFVFTGVDQRPVPSVLRDFSAPVKLQMERSDEELAFLMGNDNDPFNRWDAGQELAQRILLGLCADVEAGRPLTLPDTFVTAFGQVLADPTLDGSLKALALMLPSEKQLGMEMEPVDVDAIHAVRRFACGELARRLEDELRAAFAANRTTEPYSTDKDAIDRRRLKNTCLAYLSMLDTDETAALVYEQFESADNMTDVQAALGMLVELDRPERDRALASFYTRWKDDPLVLDKWFTVQAMSSAPDALERVKGLVKHADFTLRNPNRVRSLLGAFASANQVHFHAADGAGYVLLGDHVLELDSLNPQVASRLVSTFNPWRRFDDQRQARMKAQLERIAAKDGLSKDVAEIVGRALTS